MFYFLISSLTYVCHSYMYMCTHAHICKTCPLSRIPEHEPIFRFFPLDRFESELHHGANFVRCKSFCQLKVGIDFGLEIFRWLLQDFDAFPGDAVRRAASSLLNPSEQVGIRPHAYRARAGCLWTVRCPLVVDQPPRELKS